MGHYIGETVYPIKVSKKQIERDCSRVAEYEGDYEQKITFRWMDTMTLPNYEEARKWVEAHDRGWYDNLAVRYKKGRQIWWYCKYEFHC